MDKKRKCLALILTLIVTVSAFAARMQEVCAAPSLSSFNEYMADYYLENSAMRYWIEDYHAPYRTFVENGKANGLAADCLAWRAATFELSDLNSYAREETIYYQTILFDLLYEGEDTGIDNEDYTKAKSVVGSVKKIYKSVNVSALKKLNDLSLITTADTVITDDNLEQVLKDLKKDDYITDALNFIGNPNKYLSYVTTVTDFVDRLAQIEALLQMSREYAQIMADMQNYTENNVSGLILKEALTDFEDLCEGSITEEEILHVFMADESLKVIGNHVLDGCWDSILSLSSGIGMMITAGQKIGKYASNWMFSTDSIVENYYTMCALYNVEDVLKKEVDACEKAYKSNKSFWTAKKYNNAVRLLFRLHKIGIDYAENFKEAVYKGGNLSKLFTYLNSSDYDKVSSSLSSIKNSMESVLDPVEDFIYKMFRSEIKKVTVNSDELDTVEINEISDVDFKSILEQLQGYATKCNNMHIKSDGNNTSVTLKEDMEIYGDLYIESGKLDLNGHILTVGGDCFHSGGELDVNGGSLEVNGNYRLQSRTVDEDSQMIVYDSCYGKIVMDEEDDYICVNGDFVTNDYNGSSVYSAGVLEIKGNFKQIAGYNGIYTGYCSVFKATDTHKVVLSGQNKQTVSFDNPTLSYFNNLEIENENVEFITPIKGWKLYRDTVFGNGLSDGIEGTFDLNGHTMTIKGDFVQGDGSVYVNGGKLKVKGDYRLQNKSTDQNNNINYVSCHGKIVMDDEDDYICVYDNFITNDYGYSVYSAGILEVKGDFVQIGTGSYNESSFVAKQKHKVILSGENKQIVSFESPNSSYFNDLEIKNDDVEFATEIKGWELQRDIVFTNSLSNSIVGTFNLNGHTMTVKGDFVQANGVVDINGGKLIVTGNYLIQNRNIDQNGNITYGSSNGSIIMDEVDSYVCVNGDFVTNDYNGSSIYSAGILEVKGNFKQIAGYISIYSGYCSVFKATDTHKVVLSGKDKQVVSFDNPTLSYFNDLELISDSVEFATPIKVSSGKLLKDTTFGLGMPNGFIGNLDLNGYNLTLNGDFLQSEGELSTSGGTLTVIGNFNKTGGSINLAAGKIIVQGNYTNEKGDVIATSGAFSVDGDFTQKAGTIILSDKCPLTVGGTCGQSGGTINMNAATASIGAVKLSAGTFSGNGGTIGVNGDSVISGGTLDLAKAAMTNKGSLTQTSGGIILNQGCLTVQKDYIIESESYDQTTDMTSKSNSNGYISMQYAADRLNVDGNFIMHSGVGHSGNLKAGIITLKGDFHQVAGTAGNFAASGANTVVFAGTKKQKISFDSPDSSGFNYVRFDNSNVEVTTPIRGWALQQDTEINSDIPGLRGTWDLNGHKLTIGGKLVQDAGTISLNKGSLLVKKNYEMEAESYDQTTDITSKSNSSGKLVMKYADDRMEVDGDFIMHNNASNELTSGVLTLKGDFKQIKGSAGNYAPSNVHKIVFAGTDTQHISFDSPLNSGFNDVEFVNKDVQFLTAVKGWNLTKDTEINTSIPGFYGTLDLNGHAFTVNGSFIQNAGTVKVNKGKLTVNGNYEIEDEALDEATNKVNKKDSSGSLVMDNVLDQVMVNGNFIMHSSNSQTLTAGDMYIAGNFKQISGSSSNFNATGDHTVILNGKPVQTVSFDSESSSFNNLKLVNGMDAYQFSRENCWKNLVQGLKVESVKAAPEQASVEQGKTQQFEAEVSGDGTVTWSVSGNNSAQTGISENGLLTVAEDETAEKLTVRAASVIDSSKYAEVQVTVLKKEVPQHTHMYAPQWMRDEQAHWHSCECGEKTDLAEHVFIWVTDQEATSESTGLKHEECQTCGYKRNEGTVIEKTAQGTTESSGAQDDTTQDATTTQNHTDTGSGSGDSDGDSQKTTEKKTEGLTDTENQQDGEAASEGKTEPATGTEKPADSTEKTTGTESSTEKKDDAAGSTEKTTGENSSTEKKDDTAGSTEKTTGNEVTTEKKGEAAGNTEKTTGNEVTTEKKGDTAGSTEKMTGSEATTEKKDGAAGSTEKQSGSEVTTEEKDGAAGSTEKQSGSEVTTEKYVDTVGSTEKQIGTEVSTEKQVGSEATTEKASVVATSTEKTTGTAATTEKVSGKAEDSEDEIKQPEVGTVLQDDQYGGVYRVIVKGSQVEYTAPLDVSAKKVVIPSTVEVDDVEYKVIAIADNAFKNHKKLQKVSIGNNVSVIGKNAFSGCSKLKTVKLGKKLSEIDDKAFCKCVSISSITIPASVKQIGKQAFYGCKKLKKATVKTTNLNNKTVGKQAFMGLHARAVAKVPKKKLALYRMIFRKSGMTGKNQKIK